MWHKLFPFHRKKKKEVQKTVLFSAMSDIGIARSTNQDNLFVMQPVVAHDRLEHYSVSGEVQLPALFAICDGMGGGKNGELASYLATEMIAGVDVHQLASMENDQLEAYVTKLYQKMSDAVYTNYGHLGVLVGCTATILYLDEKRVYIVNAGDSPGMCYSGGNLQVKTQSDNRANQLYLMGQISEQERWIHKTKNQLTQYLGMDPEEVRMSPHTVRMDWPKEDTLFLLCSDGLLDKNSFQTLEHCLWSSQIEDAAQNCVQSALDAGSRDNVTAIVVKVEAQGNDA